MEINSSSNTKVKKWIKYHQKKYRDEDKLFIVEGKHLIEEAIKAKLLVTLLIRNGCDNCFDFSDCFYLSDNVIDKISKQTSKNDYLGICQFKDNQLVLKNKIIALDNIQDPGNVGTIIRSAYSFGYDVLISDDSCDIYNDKCVSATQGAIFHVGIKRCNLIEMLKDLKPKYQIYGTSLQESNKLSKIKKTENIIIVVGNEGSGVKNEILDLCHKNIKIEMNNFESLNVAIAASICMYEFNHK